MLIFFNVYVLLLAIPIGLTAWLVKRSPASAAHETLIIGGVALALDLLLRAFNYPRIKAYAARPVILTRDGAKPKPRRRVIEFLEPPRPPAVAHSSCSFPSGSTPPHASSAIGSAPCHDR